MNCEDCQTIISSSAQQILLEQPDFDLEENLFREILTNPDLMPCLPTLLATVFTELPATPLSTILDLETRLRKLFEYSLIVGRGIHQDEPMAQTCLELIANDRISRHLEHQIIMRMEQDNPFWNTLFNQLPTN